MPKQDKTIPWLERHDNGVFYVHWYDPVAKRTQRVSLRTRDSGEAKDRFEAFLREGGEIQAPRTGELTVSRALDDYYKEHVEVKVVDVNRQRDIIRHLKAYFGDQILATVDIPASLGYAKVRRDGTIGGGSRTVSSKASEGTIVRELGVLSAAARHALKWKRIVELPSIEMPRAARATQDDEALYYTKHEIEQLIMAADGDLKHFITLAYYTGARRRSIEHLSVRQIDWVSNRIHLKTPGKRSTKKRQPIVPIFPQITETLHELLGRDKLLLLGGRDFYRSFTALARMIGLDNDGRGNPHLLRHSRATHLLQDGAKVYTVAKLLGDTTTTVERVYGHHSSDHIADEIAELEGL